MKTLVVVLTCVLHLVTTIEIENAGTNRDTRKLFGGYKITPRFCKPTRRVEERGPTICMFNHECAQRNGEVVGACMDGFLFGACCQLPGDSIADLTDSDLTPVKIETNSLQVKSTTATPTLAPLSGLLTSSGVSQITNALLNAAIPTAHEDAIVQVDGNQYFSTTGVTHPSAPDTVLVHHNNNAIDPEDFKLPSTTRETTIKYEQTTPAYKPELPIIQISISSPQYSQASGYHKPIFVSKPPSDNDKYVLVPTITHSKPNNKTHEFDAIVNIIQMLNESTTANDGSSSSTNTYTVSTTRKPPPSTSYIFSATSTKRPGYKPETRATTKKSPSTSYVFSTTIPPRRPSTSTQGKPTKRPFPSGSTKPVPVKNGSTYPFTTKPVSSSKPHFSSKPLSTKKPPSTTLLYVSSSTFRPLKTTYANRPEAFSTVTKKPPSTSYVYSSTLTKRPTTTAYVSGPSFSVTPTTNLNTKAPSSPPPTVIVLGPLSTETSTQKPAPSTTVIPLRKPITQVTINNHITQNIYSSERPSPTVLITPKPSTSSLRPLIADVEVIEQATSPNDMINFPPVRNPNLNMSVPILNEDDSTPSFVEDEALNKKVESLVNKIIQGLQEPFSGLKDVVYSKNKTSTAESTTKKPLRKGSTTRKPQTGSTLAGRPTSGRPPSAGRPSTPKPTNAKKTTTKRPTTVQSTKKPTKTKPTKRITTTPAAEDETTTILNAISNDYRTQCGRRPLVKTARIVGGKGANFGEFPWQVLVRESTWLGLFTKNKCGGVLISNRYVLTAAHCQPGFLASLVAVFGEFDISGDLETKRPATRNVKRVIVHRKYDAATFENDLALLELEHPVQFDSHILPICLPRAGEDFTGRMATVTGWGRLKYGGGVPSVLQEVQVPIMENHVCQEMFRTAGHNKLILESFLCAGYANGQKDSCEGDSGGPLVLQRPDGRYQLAGTVSHGIKCAAPYLPGVYMRTAYYKPWIESITGVH